MVSVTRRVSRLEMLVWLLIAREAASHKSPVQRAVHRPPDHCHSHTGRPVHSAHSARPERSVHTAVHAARL